MVPAIRLGHFPPFFEIEARALTPPPESSHHRTIQVTPLDIGFCHRLPDLLQTTCLSSYAALSSSLLVPPDWLVLSNQLPSLSCATLPASLLQLMASAPSVTANSSTSSIALVNSGTSQNSHGQARNTMRSNNNAKAADQGRKQSPVDGAPRSVPVYLPSTVLQDFTFSLATFDFIFIIHFIVPLPQP